MVNAVDIQMLLTEGWCGGDANVMMLYPMQHQRSDAYDWDNFDSLATRAFLRALVLLVDAAPLPWWKGGGMDGPPVGSTTKTPAVAPPPPPPGE
jgi:hypothetical protein